MLWGRLLWLLRFKPNTYLSFACALHSAWDFPPVIGVNEYREVYMADSEALELVSYMVGSFAIGWGFGFLTVSFIKAMEKI